MHTPKPWRVEIWDYLHANPPRKELNIQSDTLLLATLSWDWHNDNPYVVDSETAHANAHLMAAAPDLLAALEDALDAISFAANAEPLESDCEHWDSVLKVAKAAIAKAKNLPTPESPQT